MPLFTKWKSYFKNSGKGGLRRYYFIAGTYLLVVIVVFSILVLRWGNTPSLDLPGFEETGQQQHRDGEEQAPAAEITNGEKEKEAAIEQPGQTAEAGDGAQGESAGQETPGLTAEATEEDELDDGTSGSTSPLFPGPDDEDPAVSGQQLTELPSAANPLPKWEVAVPYGNYIATALPSGATVHHLSSGVLLRTTPAAPVSALWDGVVSQVKVMDGPYRCSVLIEHVDHLGAYSTFYGNMREVWVKEGDEVSRGENIGLMAYDAGRDTGAPERDINEKMAEEEMSLPVSGLNPEGKSLQLHTVWGGYLHDESDDMYAHEEDSAFPENIVPALTPPEEGETLPPNNPLLYLEVRRGNSLQDPLNFITARH